MSPSPVHTTSQYTSPIYSPSGVPAHAARRKPASRSRGLYTP